MTSERSFGWGFHVQKSDKHSDKNYVIISDNKVW